MNQPMVYKDDDGAIIFEWIYDTVRFGICINKELSRDGAGWWITGVSGEPFESGKLPAEFIQLLQCDESVSIPSSWILSDIKEVESTLTTTNSTNIRWTIAAP